MGAGQPFSTVHVFVWHTFANSAATRVFFRTAGEAQLPPCTVVVTGLPFYAITYSRSGGRFLPCRIRNMIAAKYHIVAFSESYYRDNHFLLETNFRDRGVTHIFSNTSPFCFARNSHNSASITHTLQRYPPDEELEIVEAFESERYKPSLSAIMH